MSFFRALAQKRAWTKYTDLRQTLERSLNVGRKLKIMSLRFRCEEQTFFFTLLKKNLNFLFFILTFFTTKRAISSCSFLLDLIFSFLYLWSVFKLPTLFFWKEKKNVDVLFSTKWHWSNTNPLLIIQAKYDVRFIR